MRYFVSWKPADFTDVSHCRTILFCRTLYTGASIPPYVVYAMPGTVLVVGVLRLHSKHRKWTVNSTL